MSKIEYSGNMRSVYIEYLSKNGIRFHHSISQYTDIENDFQRAESHYMFELLLLLSGSITYNIEGKSYKIKPMEMIIIPPNELHSIDIDVSVPYERMVLHFSPDLLPSFNDLDILAPFNTTKNFAHIIPRSFLEHSNLLNLMYKCKEHCKEKNKYIDLRLARTILQIMEALNEIVGQLNSSNQYAEPANVKTLSAACIQYVNANLTGETDLHTIADALNVSASHLQFSFKKEIGITLHKYIANQKMQLARKLLMSGQPAQSVARELGYEYYSTFYNNYKKQFGVLPTALTEIQRMHWENVDV